METFCDKNKDELPKESDELFASSDNDFVVNLFAPAGGEYCSYKTRRTLRQNKHSFPEISK